MRFETVFAARAWRLDFRHTWDGIAERFELLDVIDEGPWHRLPAGTGAAHVGDYRVTLTAAGSDAVRYSVPFNSLLAELRSAAYADDAQRGTVVAVRIPAPVVPMRLAVDGRTPDGRFAELHAQALPRVARPAAPPAGEVVVQQLGDRGDPRRTLDVALVSEGYVAADAATFQRHAAAIADVLWSTPPFSTHRPRPNVWTVFAPSAGSGITDATRELRAATRFDTRFGILGIDRYLLPMATADVRSVAASAPYDTIIVVCNDEQYGGGGIFGHLAAVAGGAAKIEYLVRHEFAHSFGGLGDEYYNAPVTYEELPARPWEANVACSVDDARRKWGALLAPDLPLPTPWSKDEYEALTNHVPPDQTAAVRERVRALLEAEVHRGRVGMFEGAMYRATGYYRPEVDCLMFSNTASGYCRVCRAALEAALDELGGEPA